MRILYAYGTTRAEEIINALRKLGHTVYEYPKTLENSTLSQEEVDALVAYIEAHDLQLIVSVHLIYNLAVAAYGAKIRYVPVIWDAPYVKPYTMIGKLDNVWYSTFDKLDRQRFLDAGVPHVMYQPLAVDEEDIRKWDCKAKTEGRYICDISFVGNLYDRNSYDACIDTIPVNLQNYFRSIFEEAAFQWDGMNRIYGQTGQEIIEYIRMVSPGFHLNNPYEIEDVRLFEISHLIRKLGNIERVCVLNMLAETHQVFLYTNSIIEQSLLPGVTIKPPVVTGEPASKVFVSSKINLNISLKGIEGGTAKRVIDIMGVGGFALTNYCAETAELFEEDKEIVMFKTPEELLEKVDYYLAHDKEREEIARAGQEKVLNCFTYQKMMQHILDWAGN
ncbi:MAG: glycosyltransferase [Lachnospiraceae bacterium]|nr:glycosyltransferase [Lachnospiraceae bacterium]